MIEGNSLKIIIASNNKKKIAELKSILEDLGYEAVTQAEAGINIEPEETGKTFAENAYIKAKTVVDISSQAAIADDSGIEVKALDSAPGIYSARYGGTNCKSDVERTMLLLANMDGKEDRRARFVSSIALVFSNGDTVTAEDTWDGEIADKQYGQGGFGYDPIFYVPECQMTVAEMSQETKNKISHRAKALMKFKEKMEKYNADK